MLLDLSDLIGKPYKSHGRGPEFYDCYGLDIEVAKRLGHIVPDLFKSLKEGDPRDKEYTALSEGLVKTENPIFGDVVIFLNNKGRIFHCGIILKNREFIHCDKQGVRIANIDYYHKKGEFYTWQK